MNLSFEDQDLSSESSSNIYESEQNDGKSWSGLKYEIPNTMKDIAVVDLTTTIQEMRLKLDKYEFENQQLRYQLGKVKDSNASVIKETSIDGNHDMITFLEETIEDQTEEIYRLTEQRDNLIKIIQKQDIIVNECTISLEDRKEINDKVSSLTETLISLKKSAKEDQKDLYNQILSIIPEDVFDNASHFGDTSNKEDLVKILLLWRDMYENRSITQNVDAVVIEDKYEPKFKAILSHYESTVRFMKNIWISIVGDYEKDVISTILNQAARSNLFIDGIKRNDNNYGEGNLDELNKEELLTVIETFKLTNSSLQSRINYINSHPINDGKKEVEKLLNQVDEATAEIISMISEETGEEYETLLDAVNHIIEVYRVSVDEIVDYRHSIIEVNEAVSDLELLCEQNKQDYDERNNELNITVVNLQDQLKQASRNHENAINQMKEELEDANRIIESLKIASDRSNEMEKMLNSSMDEITTTKSALTESTELAETLTAELQYAKSSKEQILSDLNELKEFSAGLAKTLRSANKKIKHLSANNSYLLNDLAGRNKELSEKFSQRVKMLEENLHQSQEDESKATKAVQAANEKINDLSNMNARLKMSERSLNVKLQQALDSLKQNESQIDARTTAKVMSIRTQAEGQISSHISMIGEIKRRSSDILLKYFDSNVNDELNPLDLLTQIERGIKSQRGSLNLEKIFREALDYMNLPDNVSLIHLLNSLMAQANSKEMETKCLSEQKDSLTEELNKIKKEISALKLEKTKNIEWDSWSRSMYRNITDGTLPTTHHDDMKYLLEEALFSSIGHRTLRRRLDILRGEKKLLLSQNSPSLFKTNTSKSISSIRPIIITIMFSRRLQEIQGSVPVLYNSFTASLGTSPTHSVASDF